jgi:hypothetical protein
MRSGERMRPLLNCRVRVACREKRRAARRPTPCGEMSRTAAFGAGPASVGTSRQRSTRTGLSRAAWRLSFEGVSAVVGSERGVFGGTTDSPCIENSRNSRTIFFRNRSPHRQSCQTKGQAAPAVIVGQVERRLGSGDNEVDYARQGSNLQPAVPKTAALSS